VFSTSGFPSIPPSAEPPRPAAGLTDSGVSHAVIAPELYLEILLMPYVIDVIDSFRERGVLPPDSPPPRHDDITHSMSVTMLIGTPTDAQSEAHTASAPAGSQS
jgi:hypothetical protein